MKNEVNIKIELECKFCGNGLESELHSDILEVEPCRFCMVDSQLAYIRENENG